MAPKKAQAKKPQKKAAVKRPPEKEPESSPRRTSARHESQDSPQAGSATPSPSHRALVLSSPARLRVQVPNSGSQSSLEAGLVQLRRNRQLCDVTIASGFGKILAHKSVLAAHSEILARQLQDLTELDLRQASHEAVEFVVKFCYGEVGQEDFAPSTSQVNEEILKISSDFGLPAL
ncbi:Kelch-like protein diablo, partial [Durusdinium trenchii]